MKKIKVMSIFGTRPEAIKMAPLIKALENDADIESVVCVTAQHRDMLDQVLTVFNIIPDYDLDIMKEKQTLAHITIKSLTGIEQVLEKEKPDLVLVHGDTTTSFAAALAAFYAKVKIGHVEAGLRTYDKYQPYPEEMNRKLTGSLADIHFSATREAKENLLKENTDEKHIYVTGNTAIDCLKLTLNDNHVFSDERLNAVDFKNKRVITITAHRNENLGEPIENICKSLLRIADEFKDVHFVYAVHPNPLVKNTVYAMLSGNEQITLTPPLDILDMHNLMNKSYLVMTDSGGLQEEVPSMDKPVVVLRNVTERPEGIAAGTLKLAGTDEAVIFETISQLLNDRNEYEKMAKAKNPFGDGKASERIKNAIKYSFGLTNSRPDNYNSSI